MVFSSLFDNAIVEVITPEMMSSLGNHRREGSPAVTDWRSRFIDVAEIETMPTAPDPPLLSQPNSVTLRSKILPVPCRVQWKHAKRQSLTDQMWECSGTVVCRYQKRTRQFILRDGMLVKFRKSEPGRDQAWYELRSMSIVDAPFSGGVATMRFDLEERSFDADGLGDNTNDT